MQTDMPFVDEGYVSLENSIRDRISNNRLPLFTTTVDPDLLWNIYLAGIPEYTRKVFECNACRRFIQRYGGLVTIDEQGITTPLLWNPEDAHDFFAETVAGLHGYVSNCQVDGVFLWEQNVWGQPRTGDWTHLYGYVKNTHGTRLKSAGQLMAEKKEEFGMLNRSIAEFPLDAVVQAARVLNADAVKGAEKARQIGDWFMRLHESIDGKNREQRRNLTWLAVANAPTGYCHIRTSMIGTLLEDIVAGMPFEAIRKRWNEKMHPLKYQRPQAPPRAGQIDRAEKIIAELGLEKSLRRCYAALDEVLAKEWVPKPIPSDNRSEGGVFDHLRSKKTGVQEIELPATLMTWEKFRDRILPTVLTMEIKVPNHGDFYGLLTAVDPDAPPIIQWDGLEGHARNPVSWFVWHGGSNPERWNLRAGWAPVTAVFLAAHQWQEPQLFQHQRSRVFFSIDGARETQDHPGLSLFPEFLRADLREVRAVIEAHSKKMHLERNPVENANGLRFTKENPLPTTLRVRTAEGVASYTLDRWE